MRPEVKEAIVIATNEPRRIRRSDSAAQGESPASQKAANGSTKKTKPKKKHRILRGILGFIVVCMCLGIMGASAAAVGVVYYVVEATADDGDLLALDQIKLSQSSTVLAADHNTGAWLNYASYISGDSHRLWVDWESIPVNLRWAFICTEDKDFYNEPGVNVKRTVAAMVNEYVIPIFPSRQGASTIEQQLVKNITQDDGQSGIEGAKRKLREMFRAFGLYKNYSKDTTLEVYLNTISFTGTIQGVQTAAEEYFGKNASELSLAECAVIASITKNPTKYNPYTNPEELLTRRNLVLYNMYDQGKISEAEYKTAKTQPLVLAEAEKAEVVTTSSNNSYFTDALFEELVADFMAENNWTKTQAQQYVYTGGLTIYSTVDPFIQSQMENLMLNADDAYFPAGWHEEEVASLGENDEQVFNKDGTPKTTTNDKGETVYYRKVRTQAAMATSDYAGNVLALVGGLGEKTTDLSLNRAYDVPRQTGSSMKPLAAYSLAIDYGLYNWSSVINDSPLYTKDQMVIRDDDYCKKHGLSGLSDEALKAYPDAWRDWPKNYGTISGEDKLLWQGLASSLNTIAAKVGDSVGVDAMYNFAYNQLQFDHFADSDRSLSALILGGQTYGVTPVQMAAAYQIFDEGVFTTPHLYSKVYDSNGNIVLEANVISYQALSPAGATVMNRLLRNVLTSGTAAGKTPSAGGMEAVGKTGTTSDNKDLWFVGCTPYYVTSVWWGYDAPVDMTKYLGKSAKTSTCSAAWKAFMETIQGDLEYRSFPVADGVVTKTYCTASGLLATGTCASTASGYYKEDALPDYCDYGY